ncbi:putative response regulatory protein [Paenibacillus konkukensis]|uniref:Response regulatory protein n=1 Tax=Paenibacillus konkukensis TaxID=2020716 RepID=A0ABY4RWU3_9BACL|nr:response regulator [Paenibacillus konkukensis]UQZ86290.1 putative response regulatory protein [Paenibacillus konkukensis]
MFQLLIVDDESAVVDSLSDTLPWQTVGVTSVFKAYSGYEALEILKTNTIDILITDIHMPGMSGLELLAKAHRSWKKIKCILLSGHAEFDYARQAIRHNTYEYLLKPVSDEMILGKVKALAELLQKEREELLTYQLVAQAFEESLPKLRGELLNELLQGLELAPRRLQEKMELLKVNMRLGAEFALMLVRMEGKLSELDLYNLSLMEYAVVNMAGEIFEDGFRLWPCKDIHGFLVFLVTLKEGKIEEAADSENADQQLQQLASQLQLSVNHYLKGTVSVLIGKWGRFPQDVPKLYQDSLYSLRRRIGSQSGLLIYVSEALEQQPVHSLLRLYEPPLLVHLLESASWTLAEEKLQSVFQELRAKWADSSEHLVEVFFSIYASFSSLAHKNGRELAGMIGPGLSDVAGLAACRSLKALEEWTFQAFRLMKQSMENETKNDREHTVEKIKQYIRRHLTEDVSLQAVADYMYMHPVHISRIYKLETGENLSDYILRLKMEMAAVMLADRSVKNYEIALKLGYQNPNYFNKVFKKYYSLTPQEYRSKLDEDG